MSPHAQAEANKLALTARCEEQDRNPKSNLRLWARGLPDGTIEAEGKVPVCIDCQGRQKVKDFIITSTVGTSRGE